MSNTCNCPNPPGGEVVCENHQLALCIVQDGKAKYRCLNPPPSSNALTLIDWAVKEIAGDQKGLVASFEILNSGQYSDRDMEITFKLPQKLKAALEDLGRNRGDALGI